MAYNRVSAMGVEHGLMSPVDQDAARRAQMQLLMGSGGQAPAPAGDAPGPVAPSSPEILNNVGRPAYETDYMNRQLQGAKDLQTMAGNQALDLSKESTNRAMGVAGIDMKPSLMQQQRENTLFDEQAPIRELQRNFQKNALAGNTGNADQDMIRAAMAMGQSPAPFLEAQGRTQEHQWQQENSNQAAINALVAELSKNNPEVAAQLAGKSKAFTGIDPSLLQRGFGAMNAQDLPALTSNPQIMAKLNSLTGPITSNNIYFSDEDMAHLNTQWYELNKMLDTLRATPEAKAQILQMAKEKMRAAIPGGWFHGFGTDKINQGYGL